MKKLFLKDALFIVFLLVGFSSIFIWPVRAEQTDTSGNAESSSTTKTVIISNTYDIDLETENISSNNIESNIAYSIDAKPQPSPIPRNTTSKRMLPVTMPCAIDIDVMVLDFIF